MHRPFVFVAFLAAIACSTGALARSNGVDKVNGSIRVEQGEQAGDLSTVNGSIHLAEGAIAAKVSTVNGSIELGERASAQSLDTVNGAVRLGPGAKVAATIETVNGAVSLAKGADVAGHVSNVNGRYTLDAAHVGGGIETVAGDMDIGADSRVEGGILVDKSHGWSWGIVRKPRIVIGPRAIVTGTLEFRREVELYVSTSAKIGTVKGATAIAFSGAQP